MVAVKFKNANILNIYFIFYYQHFVLLMLCTPKKLLVTAKTYSGVLNIFWLVDMENLLPTGVENFLIIPFVNYYIF